MSIHFEKRHMTGFVGRKVDDGMVCETFFEALSYMNSAIEANRQAFRKVRVAKIVEFEEMVSCAVNVHDK